MFSFITDVLGLLVNSCSCATERFLHHPMKTLILLIILLWVLSLYFITASFYIVWSNFLLAYILEARTRRSILDFEHAGVVILLLDQAETFCLPSGCISKRINSLLDVLWNKIWKIFCLVSFHSNCRVQSMMRMNMWVISTNHVWTDEVVDVNNKPQSLKL